MWVKNKHKTYSGFTIVELLIVIVVIGILAAITIVAFNGVSQRATASAVQADLVGVAKQFKVGQVTSGLYPTAAATSSSGTTYQVVTNNTTNPQTFCITGTKGSLSYFITNNNAATKGTCLDDALILYLDAANAASYAGSGATWTDLSGKANNGTLVNGVGYDGANGGSLTFNGVDSYVSSSISQNYQDIVIIFQPDFALSTSSSLSGIVSSGLSTDRSLRFSGVNGTGPWTIPNPGNGNDWADTATTYYVNGSASNQLVSGWNILSGYRTNNTSFPSSFTYFIGSGYPGRYFKGKIAVIMMFNRQLTVTERQQYYEQFRGRFGL